MWRITYRNEESVHALLSIKSIRKQLQPSVLAVKRELLAACFLPARQPCILVGECGRSLVIGEIEKEIEERRVRSCGHRLYSGDCETRGPCVGRERNRCSRAYETAISPLAR